MAETIVRLEAVKRTAFDLRVAQLGHGKITRTASVTYLESDRRIEDVGYQLAMAGIRVTRCSAIPGAAAELRPAIAFDLAPLDDSIRAVDVVEIEPISLGQASARLMHRRVRWLPHSRVARDACRRLLRDEDAILGWRRIVWCSVGSLRAARTHVRLRPVVFDKAAVARQPLRWTYVRDGAIERWAFP